MWVRVDDTFYDHPRIIRVSLASQGLYWQGVSYAARHLTDGVVPREFVGRRHRLAEQLVKHNLWEKLLGGDYKIRHFLEWNPSAAKVKKQRRAARVRMNTLRTITRVRKKFTKRSPSPSHTHKDITPPTPSLSSNGHDTKRKDPEFTSKLRELSKEAYEHTRPVA